MNAKHATIGGWLACALSLNVMADSASLSGVWHSPQSSRAATWSTAAGNGVTVRVGGFSSDVLLSKNGSPWECHNSGTLSSLYAVAFGRGRFVAVGNEGAVAASTDGATWKVVKTASDDRLRSVIYAKGLFVAVGYNGTIITSPDGISWSKRRSDTAGRLHAVTFGNDRFVAITRTGEIVASADAKRWKRMAILSGTFANFACENGTFSTATPDGRSFISADGVTWISANRMPEIASVR